VGGTVVAADVRLDFDDPTDTPTSRVIADQPGTDEGARRLECGRGEDRAIEDRQPRG
jgi:hypothetical protein